MNTFISLQSSMAKLSPLAQLKKDTQTLCNAFLFLNDSEEIFAFLRDILTEDEMKEFQQRFDIAVRLYYKTSYTQIEKELWVSSTTVARVSKFLNWPHQWYKKVIERMYEDQK